MQKIMDNYQDETTFEVTVAGDVVSTSGISSPQIVLDTNNTNTLSWGINECSSSFQSVSSCETLESYEPLSTESPKVIVVPFLADNQVTGTMIANNGVHIPLIKECSIRIDPLKMTSTHPDECNVEKIIELPFSTDTTSEISTKSPLSLVSDDDDDNGGDDDSSPFLGFEVESTNGSLCELYKKAVHLIKENAARAEMERSGYSSEPILIDRDSSESILTERILTERHFMDRQPPERNVKPQTAKRPRQIQRKIVKQRLSDDQFAPQNRSRTEATVNAEVSLSSSPRKENNIMKPVVPTPERVSFLPAQNADEKNNKARSLTDSSGSDSDVIATPVTPTVSADNSATKKKLERSAGIKNNNKEKELKRLEKMRRKKELNWIAEKIQDHWRERFAAIRRKMRKKEARKRRLENSRSHSTKYVNNHRKGKRVEYSSDTDSTDSSSSSRTSCSSSSSDSDSNDSEPDTYTSDTSYTSQTSQTSHTRTSDSSDSDSSDYKYRRRHRLNKHRRPPSDTSDTSETSSSDDDDDDDDDNEPGKYVKRRKFQSTERAHSRPSTSNENCVSSRKRKSSESHRSEDLSHQQQRKMRKSLDVEEDEPRQMNSRTYNKQRQHRLNVPSTSSAAKVKKCRNSVYRSAVESTSAGDFIIK
ncbi:dentin sialophosphoprotein-like isoform X2 [Bradysia coprophila]|uniref:dentin sialophosphoprotein-like isoform X2 n=1 Tax=Bradysia coprophila TaxID=38358 RepID=UPI00187D8191|nr:dentin sialophosphoprotein-like isoform X2 [Bradysia coprophila]